MGFWRLRWLLASTVVVALAITIVLATSTSSRADLEPKRVLMLHSFGLRFKPWTDYAQFIRSGITRGLQTPVDFHDHSLLNARLNDDKADGPFVDYLHALYADRLPTSSWLSGPRLRTSSSGIGSASSPELLWSSRALRHAGSNPTS